MFVVVVLSFYCCAWFCSTFLAFAEDLLLDMLPVSCVKNLTPGLGRVEVTGF